MRIIVNTASTFKGGGVQVALSFIEECKKHDEYEFHVVLGKMLSTMIEEEQFPENFTFYRIGFRPSTRVFGLKSHNRYFKKLEKKINPDVVFTTSGPAYWRPFAPHLTGCNLPHYIYRDSPYFSKIPMRQRIKWDMKGSLIRYFFKRDSDAYVVQTDDVKQRVKKWLNTDRVYTVSNTFGSQYLNLQKAENKLPNYEENEFRFLTLSSWYPHKNIGIIPQVIDQLPDRLKNYIKFVLTIPDDIYQQHFSPQYRTNVINIGPVKPDEGPALYKECDALFLPTLLECFSASYAEAMVMEKPIITSDLGFAKTVCRDAALYADPVNPKDYARLITELIDNGELQKSLIEKGKKNLHHFATAEERAIQYLNICKKLADAGKN
jgi:glycosyltransferase involved in cell wall biosynthesis